jgi:hypothetical protein
MKEREMTILIDNHMTDDELKILIIHDLSHGKYRRPQYIADIHDLPKGRVWAAMWELAVDGKLEDRPGAWFRVPSDQ